MKKLHKQAQYLATEAQRIADAMDDKEVPASAIEEDIKDLCYAYVKLRTDMEKENET